MNKKLKVFLTLCIGLLLFSSFTLASKVIPAFDPQLENAQNTTIAFATATHASQANQLRAAAASAGLKVIQDYNGVLKVEGNAQALRAMAATGKATLSAPRAYKPFL